MCESDKAKFLTQIEAVKNTIRKLEKPFDFTPLTAFPKKLNSALETYTDAARSSSGDMTATE